jgi:hypothetical protein
MAALKYFFLPNMAAIIMDSSAASGYFLNNCLKQGSFSKSIWSILGHLGFEVKVFLSDLS